MGKTTCMCYALYRDGIRNGKKIGLGLEFHFNLCYQI